MLSKTAIASVLLLPLLSSAEFVPARIALASRKVTGRSPREVKRSVTRAKRDLGEIVVPLDDQFLGTDLQYVSSALSYRERCTDVPGFNSMWCS